MIKHLNLKTESYGISRFFFYQVPADAEIDSDSLESLTNQQVLGILPCAVLKKEDEMYIRYDELSDFTVGRLFSRLLKKEHLAAYLVNLADCLTDLQKNPAIKLDHILLDKNYIFLDHFSNRLVFIYVPIKNDVFEKVSMKEFFRDLVAAAPYDEQGDLSFFIKLHNYLSSESEMDLLDFKEHLAAFSAAVDKGVAAEAAVEQLSFKAAAADDSQSHFYSPGKGSAEAAASYEHGVLTSEYKSRMADKKKGQKLEIEEEVQYKRITRTELGEGDSLLKGASSIGGASINIVPNHGSFHEDNGGTTVLDAFHGVQEEGTTVLGAGAASLEMPKPFLLLGASSEKVVIEKGVFKLGRDPEQADYVSENRAVGRVHAEVVMEGGDYYFIDKHSTNGSFLNGKKLQPNQKNKLKHQDKIRIANEEMVFKLF